MKQTSTSFKAAFLVCAFFLALFTMQAQPSLTPDAHGILYVKVGGAGTGNGSLWANACPNVADPLLVVAQQHSGAITVAPADTIREIWVAKGTYYPLYSASGYHFTNQNFPSTATTTNRDNAFVLVRNVKLYGGFPPDANDATHNTLATRNWDVNPTILSGDIGTAGVNTDNCYHIVISAGAVGTACIDGFTISGGNGNASTSISVNGSAVTRFYGGGMINQYSSPALNHVTISENVADYGGGIRNDNSSPILTDVIISGNVANGTSNGGGGINNSSSSPILTNVTISGNSANYGGGIYSSNSSSPKLNNVTISGNSATDGAGIANSSSSPILTDVTISKNSATNRGGGIYNNASSSPILNNVTISENSASNNGGGIYSMTSSSSILTNVTLIGNSATSNGGGIYNNNSPSTKLTNVTLSGNKANNGGGIYNTSSSPILTNVTLSGNLANNNGGGIYNLDSSSPILTNITISGNLAINSGGGIHNINSSSPQIRNSIIYGNSATTGSNMNNDAGSIPVCSFSLIEGCGGSASWNATGFGIDGGGNIDANPKFVNWIDPSIAGATPNTLGDYSLNVCSPAINKGDNEIYRTARGITDFTSENDLAGNLRLIAGIIDMGAYENQNPSATCYEPYGTVSPFTYTGNDTFDHQFAATAKLYNLPPTGTLDKIGYIRTQTPIETVTATYYDCTQDTIVGAPVNPGITSRTDNPGLPIRWDILYSNPGTPNNTSVTSTDFPCTATPIGKYLFEGVIPGKYVLEISRQGFLTRYGVIEVNDSDYLGHRELLVGDVNGDLVINADDLSASYLKVSNYGRPLPSYEWKYDLNGDGKVDNRDFSIINNNLNADHLIYLETDEWINP